MTTLILLILISGDASNLTVISVKRFHEAGACAAYIKENHLTEYVFDGRFKCIKIPKGWLE